MGPEVNPFGGNPLRAPEDVRRALLALVDPVLPEGSRVRLGHTGAHFDRRAEELEGFARPLWGLAPLGPGFDRWDLYRRGLAEGTDPDASGYWGDPADRNQRLVEAAALGIALALAPDEVWEPLPSGAKEDVVRWLDAAHRCELHDNNWQFFRVLAALGLERVGEPIDERLVEASLDRIDGHYQGDGWYTDGALPGNVDHYVGWAYHAYGLIYARLRGDRDPARASRFRERAARFATDFQHWFDPTGRVVPYGRSLTYRFAAASFWAALAFADVEALPWGRVKGLYLRHLRSWAGLPICDPRGVLTLGWAYPNLRAAENYNSPGSPYWAAKAFLALAVPEDHPFWTAEEEALPPAEPSTQQPPRMLLTRDATQTQMLVGGRGFWFVGQGAAKYGKFAYSSAFGFSLDSDELGFSDVSDSMLLLRDDSGSRRVRRDVEASGTDGSCVWSRWKPWGDVTVETVLTGRAPWHVRFHRVRTERRLHAAEAGFALGWDGGVPGERCDRDEGQGGARVTTDAGRSEVVDLMGDRGGGVRALAPNANLVASRALVPVLEGTLEPGEHVLGCHVVADEGPDGGPGPDADGDAFREAEAVLDRIGGGA